MCSSLSKALGSASLSMGEAALLPGGGPPAWPRGVSMTSFSRTRGPRGPSSTRSMASPAAPAASRGRSRGLRGAQGRQEPPRRTAGRHRDGPDTGGTATRSEAVACSRSPRPESARRHDPNDRPRGATDSKAQLPALSAKLHVDVSRGPAQPRAPLANWKGRGPAEPRPLGWKLGSLS